MRSATRVYRCNSDRAILCTQKFVVFALMRDDLTEVHRSNFKRNVQSASDFFFPFYPNSFHNGKIPMHLGWLAWKFLIVRVVGELQTVMEAQFSFKTLPDQCQFGTFKRRGECCVLNLLFLFRNHDLTSQLPFQVFSTCMWCNREVFCSRIFCTDLTFILVCWTTPLVNTIAAFLSGSTSNFFLLLYYGSLSILIWSMLFRKLDALRFFVMSC